MVALRPFGQQGLTAQSTIRIRRPWRAFRRLPQAQGAHGPAYRAADLAELARQVAAGSRHRHGIDSVFLWQGAERPGVEN
ncbi:MAG: hypothetical protein ACLU98_10530 [Desulfovibrio fairfieldensis]